MEQHKKQPEYHLQVQIASYLKLQYPNVRFLSDTIASVRLTLPQAMRNKKIQDPKFKAMDVLILEPRGNYHGLFIELKVETPFKKDGTLKAGDHLKGQQKSIDEMNEKGYRALFSWGFDRTRKVIDDYMKLEKNCEN